MTLTVDQLEVLVTEPFVNGSIPTDILDAIILDFAAMRQPITPEALLAAGWERQYKTVDAFWRMPGHHLFIGDGTIKIWIGRVDGVWASTNAQTMHDLAQLVRLLGGIA